MKIVFEIGVGHPSESRCADYVNNTGFKCYLFEPNVILFKQIKEHFSEACNLNIYNYAISDKSEPVELYNYSHSSCVVGVKSPLFSCFGDKISDIEKFNVECKSILEYDEGNIDLLLLDCEGGEWPIIKEMISRPSKIIVEMKSIGVNYTNPFYNEIETWMENNGYRLKEIINNDSDYVFVKKDED